MLLSEADPLTVEHQARQLRIARTVQQDMAGLWALMNFTALDESTRLWLPLAVKAVLNARAESSMAAQMWYSALRELELGEGVAALATSSDDALRVAESLRITGPVRVKQAVSRGLPRAAAMQRGLVGVLGATQKHTLDGGRQATIDLVGMEPRTTYYQRVASGVNSCKFCLMLASRGPVYTADTGRFKAHDACGCTLEPKFAATKKRRSTGSGSRRRQWTEYQGVAPLSGPTLPTT